MTCLLNPKAYMFTLAVMPQFVRPEYGAIVPQVMVIGAMTAATQIAVQTSPARQPDGPSAPRPSRRRDPHRHCPLDGVAELALKLRNTRRHGDQQMTRMRLYSGPLSMFGAKAQIAALEKGLDVDVVMVPFTVDHRYHPKHPDVLRVNPKQQVPVLIHGDVEIFDSTQIFEYFEHVQPEPALWPASPAARARARLLEHQSDEVYFPHIIRLMGLQQTPDDPAAVAARAATAAYYQRMETLLAAAAYLAGPMTYADIAFYMAQVFGDRMGSPVTEATPKLQDWRDRMTARPSVRKVVGAIAAHLTQNSRPVPAWLRAPLNGTP